MEKIEKEILTQVDQKVEGQFIYESLKDFDREELTNLKDNIICMEVEKEKLTGNESHGLFIV